MNNKEKAKFKDDITFSQEAESVVNNPAYQYAMTAMRGKIFEKLESSDLTGDNESILEQVRSLQSIAKMQAQLENIIAEGNFALAHLEQDTKTQKRNNR